MEDLRRRQLCLVKRKKQELQNELKNIEAKRKELINELNMSCMGQEEESVGETVAVYEMLGDNSVIVVEGYCDLEVIEEQTVDESVIDQQAVLDHLVNGETHNDHPTDLSVNIEASPSSESVPVYGPHEVAQKNCSSEATQRDNTSCVCLLCGLMYETTHDCLTHWTCDHGTLLLNCSVCHQKFFTQTELEKHILSHEDISYQQPEIDEQQFAAESGIVLDSSVKYEDIELDEDGGLDCVVEASEDHCEYITCDRCKKVLTSAKSYQQHMRWHSLQHQCRQCGRRFANPYNLRYHERMHSGERPHLCPECGQTFRIPGALTLHMRVHSDSRPYCCGYCGATFRRRGNLREHVLFKHEPEKLVECTQCERRFVTQLKLSEHMHTHSGERPYECNLCLKSFHSHLRLASHRRRVHPEAATTNCSVGSLEERQCKECGRVLSCKESLIVHMRRHKGDYPYCCPECPKRFASSAELSFHRLTHSTEKRFSCELCGNLFKRKKTLVEHQQNVHGSTQRQPVLCKYCGATFNTAGAMYKHRRKHHSNQNQLADHKICTAVEPSVASEVIIESSLTNKRRYKTRRTRTRVGAQHNDR